MKNYHITCISGESELHTREDEQSGLAVGDAHRVIANAAELRAEGDWQACAECRVQLRWLSYLLDITSTCAPIKLAIKWRWTFPVDGRKRKTDADTHRSHLRLSLVKVERLQQARCDRHVSNLRRNCNQNKNHGHQMKCIFFSIRIQIVTKYR